MVENLTTIWPKPTVEASLSRSAGGLAHNRALRVDAQVPPRCGKERPPLLPGLLAGVSVGRMARENKSLQRKSLRRFVSRLCCHDKTSTNHGSPAHRDLS